MMKGQKIAISLHRKAIAEDCVWADILISKRPVQDKSCQASKVIDYFDVWRYGAHAIWIGVNQIKVETVQEQRGKRPWTITVADKN